MILGSTRLQRIGVRFAEVQQGTMERLIRTTGTVESDTSRRSEVTLRFPAYVKKVLPKQVGDAVAAGEVLAYVESPELAAAQQEVLFALKIAKGSTTEGSANGPASALPHGTHLDPALGRERLRSMGMSDADIAAVLKKGQAAESIAVRAPMAGTLLQTAARDGARVESGQVLFLIGDLRQNYVIARVFQPDLPFVKVGQKVTLSVPGFDGRTVEGLVDLIYPVVSATEGTAQVRIVPKEPLPWSQLGGALEVRIAAAWHTERMIPLEAVLYAGERTYVFVDRGEGRLQATPVVLGRRNRTHVEVLEGLEPGMKVAASGTFLLSSEANLRSALPKWQSKGAEDRSPSPAPQKSTP